MNESRQVTQVENRGGDHVDWGKAVAGEPLPGLVTEYLENDSAALPGEAEGCLAGINTTA